MQKAERGVPREGIEKEVKETLQGKALVDLGGWPRGGGGKLMKLNSWPERKQTDDRK